VGGSYLGRSLHCGIPDHTGSKFGHRSIHLHAILVLREDPTLAKTSLLKRLWEGWKRIGRKIGDFQARVLLTVFYAVLILPFGLAVRIFADPLRIRKLPTQWLDHPDEQMDFKWAHRQS
jgi:hypothetical protein